MSSGMKTDDMSIERVQQLVERAERLRMQSAAVPVKDLKVLLQVCETVTQQRNASSACVEPADKLLHPHV
jgi:hypothetical protein